MECMASCERKRSHEGDLSTWNNCPSKRLCNGVAGAGDVQVEYGAGTDCAMETWDTRQPGYVAANNPAYNTVGTVLGGHPLQRCPRCMAGEPGHMNHIMGY
ncbi:hypothetical protein DPEC_G00031340 [Dallia pectoralis]|uniref:Uncharacterized protein n=1 Tax=Dallia pectoralis TaxID=75939 RepID=A0ACC2HC70_DALPE|nr:hypothetical protein DPEC_G00031340 [Dallia pectoralis]